MGSMASRPISPRKADEESTIVFPARTYRKPYSHFNINNISAVLVLIYFAAMIWWLGHG